MTDNELRIQIERAIEAVYIVQNNLPLEHLEDEHTINHALSLLRWERISLVNRIRFKKSEGSKTINYLRNLFAWSYISYWPLLIEWPFFSPIKKCFDTSFIDRTAPRLTQRDVLIPVIVSALRLTSWHVSDTSYSFRVTPQGKSVYICRQNCNVTFLGVMLPFCTFFSAKR